MELFSDILDVLNTTLSESVKKKRSCGLEEPDKTYIKKMNLVRLNMTYKESSRSLSEHLANDIEFDDDEFKNYVKTYKYMLRNQRTDDELKQKILKSVALLYYMHFGMDGLWIDKYNKCITIILSERSERDDKLIHSSLINGDSIVYMFVNVTESRKLLLEQIKHVESELNLMKK